MLEKMVVNVNELAHMLGISRQVAYDLTKRPGFPAIRVSDRRIVIPTDKLHEWLDREASKEWRE